MVPLLPGAIRDDLAHSLASIKHSKQEDVFFNFIIEQGLGPLWHEMLVRLGEENQLSARNFEKLHQSRLHATGLYLIQRKHLQCSRTILDDADVPHVVIKGADLRECYYAEPALRPAEDLDLLVNSEDKVQAIRAFQQYGYQFYGTPENISHECTLVKGNASIDLHWDILRPGRTRISMVPALIQGRIDRSSHWGLSGGAQLFIMLAHPVMSKYTTTAHASLVRVLDLAFLNNAQSDASASALALLDTAGLQTAGWITATWAGMHVNDTSMQPLTENLAPGPWRQRYLQSWLSKNLSEKWLAYPKLIQVGFTLPAHDSTSDAQRALEAIIRHRRLGLSTLTSIQTAIA